MKENLINYGPILIKKKPKFKIVVILYCLFLTLRDLKQALIEEEYSDRVLRPLPCFNYVF